MNQAEEDLEKLETITHLTLNIILSVFIVFLVLVIICVLSHFYLKYINWGRRIPRNPYEVYHRADELAEPIRIDSN